jgi:hypothetical protein
MSSTCTRSCNSSCGSSFHHPNAWCTQAKKLIFMQFFIIFLFPSALLGQDTTFSILPWNTTILSFSLKMRRQVSHKTISKTVVLCLLICRHLGNRQEGKGFYTEGYGNFLVNIIHYVFIYDLKLWIGRLFVALPVLTFLRQSHKM